MNVIPPDMSAEIEPHVSTRGIVYEMSLCGEDDKYRLWEMFIIPPSSLLPISTFFKGNRASLLSSYISTNISHNIEKVI